MTETLDIPTPTAISHRGGVLSDFEPDEQGMPTPREAPTLEASHQYLQSLATGHYENFSVLTRLVPKNLRPDFAAVYGFCRWSDDLADETGHDEASRAASLELLTWWRSQLDACFAYARGESDASPRHPVYVALAETARKRELAPEPFHHLIDAFVLDQTKTRYDTWDEALDYCKGSADPVGRIVLALAGHNGSKPGDAERIAMSDATCTALQLTNHWQDVRRDLIERDRVYLPREDTGLSADELRDMLNRGDDPEARVRYIRAVRPLVERTRALFIKGRPLVRSLDPSIRPVVWLFGAGGESVLTRIERMGCATLWRRPTLSKAAKLKLIGIASTKAALSRGSQNHGTA